MMAVTKNPRRGAALTLLGGLGLSVALLVAGCATAGRAPLAGRTLVCPQCRTVLADDGETGDSLQAHAFRDTGGEHRCPGCQGVLTTWLTEGQWEHHCTICRQVPFTCAAHGW